ncbi:hypothetical protein PybrP1_004151 [[Pythium] brassicae (nom. inval.)]|nr:hypothetical protein PybrP1_004151 [[Pythium] brassicae (nom. inval.)]
MVEMEKSLLKKLCRDMDLYVTPSINDKLYLHYKGFRAIKNLDEYTGLKVLWLEGNGLGKIEGLEHQTQLRTLYLHENLINKIEGLDVLTQLDTLNLSQNQITRIENLEHLQALTSLALKGNYIVAAQDIEHVLKLPNLSVFDLQSNRITDAGVVDVLAQMPELKVLYLQGNDVVKYIKQYRKTVIFRCRKLKYLDDRPVFADERRRVEAWGSALEASNGDYKAAQEAEREEMEVIRREKKELDELNFLHFEQMMIEGRRKRKEDEAEVERKKNERQTDGPEQQRDGDPVDAASDVSAFSGERILPVQDCEFLQQEREKRWAAVVNANDGVSARIDNQAKEQQQLSSSVGAEREEASAVIPVDTRRLEVLHQCATVGSGSHSSRDPFVDASFGAEDAAAAERRQQVIKEKAGAKVAAMILTQEEIDACRESFVHFDRDGSGTIDKYELAKVLEAMGQKPTDEELFQMIAEVDNDNSGEIEFAEFLKVIEAQKLRAAQFDDESDFIDAFVACGGAPDKSGHVERRMLVQLIKKDFGLPIDIDRMLDELDTDGSGEIEYDEFKALLS